MLLYVHRDDTLRIVRDGEPRMATSTFTRLLSSEKITGNSLCTLLSNCKEKLIDLQFCENNTSPGSDLVNMVLNVHRNHKAY